MAEVCLSVPVECRAGSSFPLQMSAGKPFFQCLRRVEIAQLAGDKFSRASIQMPNQRAIARIKKRSAKAVPFTDCSEHAACVSLCLFEHILRIHRDFFRFDDSEQSTLHKQAHNRRDRSPSAVLRQQLCPTLCRFKSGENRTRCHPLCFSFVSMRVFRVSHSASVGIEARRIAEGEERMK